MPQPIIPMEAKTPNPSHPKIQATGRRKTSVAKVWLTPNGKGVFSINGKTMENFFGNHPWQKYTVQKPLLEAKMEKADVHANVLGGGISGQADAIRLGVARAVAQIDLKLKKLMRQAGFLTRDPRITERKKPGQPKARKRFQFSKR